MKKLLITLLVLVLTANCFALELERQKNVATYISFPLVDTDGNFETGESGSGDSEIDTFSDGAAPDGWTDCTNEITENGTSGWYSLSLTQAEMNADYIQIQIKSAGAMTQGILIRTTIGDPLNYATTDDGGTINVTGGKIDEVSTLTNHTAQTGDTYALANNGTYGFAALEALVDDIGVAGAGLTNINLPNQTMDITGSLSGSVGSVSGAVGSVAGNVDGSVGSLSGHTNQTGDTYALANNGTYGFSALEGLVDDIGAAGAGLSAIPWNANWDTEVQSEVADAIVVYKLDHLVYAADGDDPADNSIIAMLAATGGDWSTFAKGTDSMQATRDRGDAAWTSGAAAALSTDVATSNTTTSFTLTAGTAVDDAYNDMQLTVTDADGNTSTETRRISDWTSGLVVTVDTAFSFTPAVGDVVTVEQAYLGVSVSGGDATEANQTTMLVRLAAIMSKAAADPSLGTYNVATDSLEAQQENPQGPPILD